MTLTDTQRGLIRSFLSNPQMVEAVEAALLPSEPFAAGVDKTKDDAEYGRAVKVWLGARELLNEGFSRIKQYAPTNPQPAPENGSR